MKTTQFTVEQIIKILEQAEKGDQTIATLCRTYGIAENTFAQDTVFVVKGQFPSRAK